MRRRKHRRDVIMSGRNLGMSFFVFEPDGTVWKRPLIAHSSRTTRLANQEFICAHPTSRRWEPRLELVCLIDREWEAEDDGPAANPVLRLTVLHANCGWGRDLDRVFTHDLAHAATAR